MMKNHFYFRETANEKSECNETVWIPDEEKIKLAARVWMPTISQQIAVPAILEHIPNRRRDFTRARDEAIHTKFASGTPL